MGMVEHFQNTESINAKRQAFKEDKQDTEIGILMGIGIAIFVMAVSATITFNDISVNGYMSDKAPYETGR